MSETTLIRVMIVDDQKVVRTAISMMIMTVDDFELVGEATNGKEAISLCNECHPDVIIMDMMMPDIDGLIATELILQNQPDVKIIILTGVDKEGLKAKALQAGAASLLLKDCPTEELINTIRAVHANRHAVDNN